MFVCARIHSGAAPTATLMNTLPVVRDWAWDSRGSRLAVLLGPPHPAAGCLALYATSAENVIQVRSLEMCLLAMFSLAE